MINFKTVELCDKQWVEEITKKFKLSCEYCFGNMYAYTAKMSVEAVEIYGCLSTKCYYNGILSYCYPVGDGDRIKAVEAIIKDGIERKEPFVLFGVNDENAKELTANFKGVFELQLDRDGMDYIYLRQDLAELKGKKYQPKRNHISYFKNNQNWSYERIDKNNIDECIEMSRKWLESFPNDYEHLEDLKGEFKIIQKVFENYGELGFIGGLIRADGKVVAYTMGEAMSDDTFCVHFEKAFSEIRGAYPMINQQFVLNELSSYTYVDREDDLGIENMRKAKLSYHPFILPEKYDAVYIL